MTSFRRHRTATRPRSLRSKRHCNIAREHYNNIVIVSGGFLSEGPGGWDPPGQSVAYTYE